MRHLPVTLLLVLSIAGCVLAQTPVKLNLQDAEALALQNHPQVLAAQHVVSAMSQKIEETGRRITRFWPGMSPARRAIHRRASERVS